LTRTGIRPGGLIPILISVLVLTGCAGGDRITGWSGTVSDIPDGERLEWISSHLPPIPREFRAAWIATVANIDWPSEPGLPVHQQQDELIDLLDRASLLNLNAVVFQIRPTADALYASDLEPWSWYLTGESGLNPGWDPLTFAIDESRRRGLEMHVWFNPYRAHHPIAEDSVAANHVSNTMPGSVHTYGVYRWMDPGAPEVADHSFNVIMDVVERYDIDGVHMDDYFYPYSVNDDEGNAVPFPDSASFAVYGDDLSLADWRRRNVDRFIERVYAGIKERKPWVLFGISPFGIWRPGYPEGIRGFDQYEGLYADARKWLNLGWVDYFTPQLYWPIASEGQPYGPLLRWWVGENTLNRHVWPGNGTYRVNARESIRYDISEVADQIRLTRETAGATGNIHFSMQALIPSEDEKPNNDALADDLVSGVYSQDAVVPRTSWLGQPSPEAPVLDIRQLGGKTHVDLTPGDNTPVRWWAIHLRTDDGWTFHSLPGTERTIPSTLIEGHTAVVVRAVARLGLESAAAVSLLPARELALMTQPSSMP